MEPIKRKQDSVPAVAPRKGDEEPTAWAMIEPGRYQPRRIRGSCLGRELG